MWKATTLFICFIFLTLPYLFGQGDAEIKRIHKKFEISSDSIKIQLCKKLYEGYFYSKLDKALEYAQKGYNLAQCLNSNAEIADFSNKIGSIYMLQSKYSSALIYLLKSIKIAEEMHNDDLLANSYNKIALTYLDQKNFPKALDYFFLYFKFAEKNNDKAELATLYNNIAMVYEKQGIYYKALAFYYKSLTLNEELGRPKEICSIYNNIGHINTLQHKYSSSFAYFFKSLHILREIKDTVLTVTTLNNIGSVYDKQKNHSQAIKYYFEAFKMAEKMKDKTGMAYCLHNIASTYSKDNQLENALVFEDKSYKIAQEIGSKEYIRLASLGLAGIYAQLENYKMAFEYHLIYTAYKDSILYEKNNKQIAESKINYEAEKNEKEIEVLKREQLLLKQRNEIQNLNLSKRTLLIYTLILIIFFVVALVIVLFNRIKLNKSINDKLETKVRERTSSLELAVNELFKTNNELDNFIYRSSHDLSGPLATLSGLCNVAMLDVNDSIAQQYFSKLKQVIDRMTNLLHLIIDIGNIKHHTVDKTFFYLRSFIEGIIIDLGMEKQLKDINLKIDIPDHAKIETDKKMLEVVIHNIVKNALQYSMPPKYNHIPYIKISLKETSSFWEISIADNGFGIPPEFSEKIFDMFFKGTNQSSGFGLGLYKAKNAIEKIGGEINLYNLNSYHKTLFIISIPKNGWSLRHSFFFDLKFKGFRNKNIPVLSEAEI